MKPGLLLGAALVLAWAARARRRGDLGGPPLVAAGLVAAGLLAAGLGAVEPPDLPELLADAGRALGKWTYLVVGALAFLETGAFVGLVVPGETAVIGGGVIAGQGEVELFVLIGVVWACAVAGDLCSYALGRRLGRDFLSRHGRAFGITPARLEQVDRFFERHGPATIVLARFVGVARALAPFLAGASRLPLGRFVAADVLGAGLWAGTFVMLGFLFWRSLDQVAALAGRGATLLGVLVALGAGVAFVRRVRRDPARRAELRARAERLAQRPAVRPLAGPARAVWAHAGRPGLRAAEAAGRWGRDRLTPGGLGLELTALLAVAAVGAFVCVALADLVGPTRTLPGDGAAFDAVRALGGGAVVDVARAVSPLGRFTWAAAAVAAAALVAVRGGRRSEAAALAVGLAAASLGVHAIKSLEARPRPLDALVAVHSPAYPSGHATYAVALVAAALVAARAPTPRPARWALLGTAVAVALAVAGSRVVLRAHYLSDVLGGLALGLATFGLAGAGAVVAAHARRRSRV